MNVIIVGNGFDLEHGLLTSYKHFRKYLDELDWSYLESLEKMYGFYIDSKKELVEEYLWTDFETNLSKIDETYIIEQGENIDLGLESGDIEVEDTLYDYWEEQYRFIERLNDFIMSWIKGIDIAIPRKTNNINTEDLYITFNYTLLLEEVYNIDKYDVLHIHGSIDGYDRSPIIGHGNKKKIREIQEICEYADENLYEKKSAIYREVKNYYERTLKDVDYFISANKYFFSRLRSAKSISIIGHSLGDVDMPYFKEIFNNVSKDTIWKFYLHEYTEDKIIINKKKIMSIGVNEDKIKILESNLFFK